mgnify:CR=1 FL=1
MKTFKKVLASALAAAMVVTAFPVTNAEAATKAKLSATKATVYAGQVKTIKVTAPAGATVKATKSNSNIKIAYSKTKKTLRVRGVKAGKAKVTVKVTPKKGKATNLKATITVKNEAIRVSGDSVVAVGATTTLKTATAPKNATVTFKSSDDTIATVDEKGVVTGVKAGKVTITATAGKASKDVEIEVKTAILKSVKQTEVNVIEATVLGDTSAIKPADVKITNTATKATVPVKDVVVSKKDATLVTITTFTNMADAKEYAVNYAGVDATFTATNGTVASVGVTKTEIAANNETPVQMVTKDANQVVLGRTDLDKGSASKGCVSAETTITNGYVNGTNVYLPAVGDKMTIKVTYHTGTFAADGNESGNISDTFTITAVDPSAVNYTFALTIDGSQASPVWNAKSFVANTKVAVNADNKYGHIRVLDDENVDVTSVAGKNYTVVSADKSKVLVDESKTLDQAFSIKGVAEGSTYILIKKDNNTVATIPVTVVAAPVATSLSLSQSSVTVVKDATIDEIVKLQVKDQYGGAMDMSKATTDVAVVGKTNKTVLTDADAKALLTSTDTFTISGDNLASETEYGTITLKFSAKIGDKTVTAALPVRLVKADGTVSYKVRFDNNNVDTTVTSDTSAAQTIKASVVEMVNGGAKDYANVSGDVTYVVKNAKGEKIAEINSTKAATTCAAISSTSNYSSTHNELEINASEENASNEFTKNLEAGTYTVTANFQATADSKDKSVTATFTVKDTQDSLASIDIVNDDFGSKTIATAVVDPTLVHVYYDGVVQDGKVSYVKSDATTLANGGAFLKSVTVMVNVTGTSKKVPVTISVNRTIANCN